LLKIGAELQRRLADWSRCDAVICCPLTLPLAKEYFPRGKFITVTTVEQLSATMVDPDLKPFHCLGVISPWALDCVYRCPGLTLLLAGKCRRSLMFLLGDGLDDEVIDLRRRLHHGGFYEIGILTDSDGVDFSSIDLFPTRNLSLRASHPGLPRSEGRWLTHWASRTALPFRGTRPWRSVFGCTRYNDRTGITMDSQGTALLVRDAPDAERFAREISVYGVAQWTPSARTGVAALVACYGGPSDNRMYAARVDSAGSPTAIVSLWRVHDGWTPLFNGVELHNEVTNREGVWSLPFWLKVSADEVSVGSTSGVLAKCIDKTLPRLPTAGIRLTGSGLSLADVSIDCRQAEAG
jgi:hypothetical protein